MSIITDENNIHYKINANHFLHSSCTYVVYSRSLNLNRPYWTHAYISRIGLSFKKNSKPSRVLIMSGPQRLKMDMLPLLDVLRLSNLYHVYQV